jgi:hypothetical protein
VKELQDMVLSVGAVRLNVKMRRRTVMKLFRRQMCQVVMILVILHLAGCGSSTVAGGGCGEAGTCPGDGGGYEAATSTLAVLGGLDGSSRALDLVSSGAEVRGGGVDVLADVATVDAVEVPVVIDAHDVAPVEVVVDVSPRFDAWIDVPPGIDAGIDVSPRFDAGVDATASADALATCRSPTYLPDQPAGSTQFRDGACVGLLGGPAIPAWGERDGVTGPTCLPGDYVPGVDRSCSQYLSWGSGSALCLSGRVPVVPTSELGSSWGLGIEISAGCSGELGQDFTSVSATLSGVPDAAVRAGRFQLALAVRGGDGGSSLYYAADDGRGVAHDLVTFNTKWWAPSEGTYLQSSQARHVTAFYVIVASSAAESFTVVDMCLSQVAFK